MVASRSNGFIQPCIPMMNEVFGAIPVLIRQTGALFGNLPDPAVQ